VKANRSQTGQQDVEQLMSERLGRFSRPPRHRRTEHPGGQQVEDRRRIRGRRQVTLRDACPYVRLDTRAGGPQEPFIAFLGTGH
jgi:hypothetical protein